MDNYRVRESWPLFWQPGVGGRGGKVKFIFVKYIDGCKIVDIINEIIVLNVRQFKYTIFIAFGQKKVLGNLMRDICCVTKIFVRFTKT